MDQIYNELLEMLSKKQLRGLCRMFLEKIDSQKEEKIGILKQRDDLKLALELERQSNAEMPNKIVKYQMEIARLGGNPEAIL